MCVIAVSIDVTAVHIDLTFINIWKWREIKSYSDLTVWRKICRTRNTQPKISPRSRPCTNWSGCCMYGFGEIEPKVWVNSSKTALSFVFLATWEQKWLCWDLKLSNEGSFVEIRQETTKLGRKVWKKSLESLRADLESLRVESIAVCMQRWSFRRRSLS